MNTLRFLFVVVLLGLTNAYSDPYASFTSYWYSGCNETLNNYVYSLYLYPADGSCFSPSGGSGELYPPYGYRITYNATTVTVSNFYNPDCTGTEYSPEYYARDACTDYAAVSIYQTLPPNQYWVDLGIVGYGNQTWETVLVTSYYSNTNCNGFSDIEIQGWPECYYGANYYCQNDQIHYDACTDTATCASGCIEVYAPLSDACTATSNAPTFWSYYLNTFYATTYQATCAGAVPSPSVTPTPSSSPSAFPSSLPPSDSSSSSDGPSDGVWVLLMIICFLVGVIVGLLLGLVIYGKLNAKKRSAEANNGYMQLPPYGMPMPFFPPPQQ